MTRLAAQFERHLEWAMLTAAVCVIGVGSDWLGYRTATLAAKRTQETQIETRTDAVMSGIRTYLETQNVAGNADIAAARQP